jgi:hypothetical protein
MHLPITRKFLLVAGLIGIIAACQSQTPPPLPTPTPAPPTLTPNPTPLIQQAVEVLDPETQAIVRFVVAVPNAPRVDVYVGNSLAVAQLGYGVLTSAIARAAGQYMVRVVRAGDVPGTDNLLLQEPLSLDARETVLGVLGGAVDKFSLIRITENIEALEAGQTRVQALYALSGDESLEVTVGGQKIGTLQHGGQLSDPFVLKAGRTDVQVTRDGQPVLSQSITLIERQAYTLVLTGAAKATLGLTAANSATIRNARLRVINVSEDAGPLDVNLNGKPIVQGLDRRQVSDWQSVPAYARTLEIFKAGTQSSPLVKTDLILRPDQSGDLVIYEPVAALKANLYWENLRLTAAKTARLSVLNMARGTASLQMTAGSKPLPGFPALRYAEISLGGPIPAGSTQLAFNALNEDKPRVVEQPAKPIDFAEGVAYLYIVTGEKADPLLLSTKVGVEPPVALPTPTPTFIPPDVMQVRVINATQDIDSFDVWGGKVPLFRMVKRGQWSETSSSVDELNSAIKLNWPSTDRTFTQTQLRFMPGKSSTLIAVGRANADVQLLQPRFDEVPLQPDMAQVQVAHISAVTPPVTVEAASASGPQPTQKATQAATKPATPARLIPSVTNKVIASQLARSELSRVMALDPGSYTFLAHDDKGAPLGATSEVKVEAGKRYVIVIMGEKDTTLVGVVVVEAATQAK